jgi:hypothetical protein
MGSKFYSFGAEAARIAHDISVAASHFKLSQLPELYTAFEREETNFPVQYIGAQQALYLPVAAAMAARSRRSRHPAPQAQARHPLLARARKPRSR